MFRMINFRRIRTWRAGIWELLRFGQRSRCRFIQFQTTYQILYFLISVLQQYIGSQITSQPHSAIQIDRLVPGDFFHPIAHIIQRNIDSPLQSTERKLIGSTDIHQRDLAPIGSLQLTPIKRLHLSVQYISGYISRHCHRVFGRRKRRSICLLQGHQIIYSSAMLYHLREFVNALVYSAIAHNLRSEQFAIGRRECYFNGHL